MNARSFKSGYLLIAVIILFFTAANALSAEYKAMQGVESSDTVFDFRVGDPTTALGHLELIHSMKNDPNMEIQGEQPEIVVVFIGPSVKLVSTDRSGFDQQEQENLREIADKISSMDKDGIKFEICMTAARPHDVDPGTIFPEIEKVENGWISIVGYQKKGYAMVADF